MSITPNQAPVMVQAGGPFLPMPRVPGNNYPAAAGIAAVVGAELAAPLLELEQAYANAEQAVAELERNRPGDLGSGFRAALAEDLETYAAGARPKKFKAAALVEGDPQRWVLAYAACGHAKGAPARCDQRLERRKIAAVAGAVADGHAAEWAEAAAAGWESRGDPAAGWQHRRRGEQALGEYVAAMVVVGWAAGRAWDPGDSAPPAYRFLPENPAARGQWLCLGLVLEPATTWLTIPREVEYPEGGEELAAKAMPESGERFVALLEKGHYEVER